ncbi:hypothetical protein [Ferruginibacter sp.]|nr:hypothetical protein [Ferruginibacter sp.]
MRYSILVFGCFLLPFFTLGNAAMPGVWQIGFGGRFLPLIAADSSNYGKIKMQSELVLIDLYNGFSVVKGTYYMYNAQDTEVEMYTGYPQHGDYNQDIVKNIIIGDAPFNMKVLVNGFEVTSAVYNDSSFSANNLSTTTTPAIHASRNYQNWFLWKMKFAPKKLTNITVYFVTNNSKAKLTSGYSKSKGHAFGYVLESGKAWAGNIDTGNIFIRMMDGITLKNISGILPDSTIKESNGKLAYSFINKDPSAGDNLLIWYNKDLDSIAFTQNVLPKTVVYFAAINNFPVNDFANSKSWQTISLTDFTPQDSGLGKLVIGLLIGGVLIIGVVIWLVIKLIGRLRK